MTQKNNFKNNQTIVGEFVKNNLSAKNIWGQIVMHLRETKNPIMHVVCGDITNVCFENDVFKIKTKEQSIANMLHLQENFEMLKQGFKMFNITNFEIELTEKQKFNEQNIAVLKKYFNNQINIIE